jgi:8-oxo-dGTP diphosphatase
MVQAAAMIIQRSGSVLMLKRGSTASWMPGKWNFPTGRVEDDESVVEAAIRETAEESGISANFPQKVITLNFPEATVTYFHTFDSSDTEPVLNFESSEYRWVPVPEVVKLDTIPGVDQALKALSGVTRVVAKQQALAVSGLYGRPVGRFASSFNLTEFNALARDMPTLDEWFHGASTYLEDRGAKLLGFGMGRSVYALPGDRVIKLAKSQFGREQNQQEEFSYDSFQSLKILLPVLDAADDGRWLISPLAKLASSRDLVAWSGVPREVLHGLLEGDESLPTSDLTQKGKNLIRFAQKEDMVAADLVKLDSWGKWRGELWLLDYGLSKDVARRMKRTLYRAAATQRVVALYKNKKQVKKQDGKGTTTVYEYSKRQVQHRNREKAKRIEKLRQSISNLRAQVGKDLKSSDPDKFLTALAVGLIDETYERVGNDVSAKGGHFGVTGWRKNHVSFNRNKAIVSYVGKSGVKQKKMVSNAPLVRALRDACEAVEGEDCLFCHDTGKVDANKINAYLRKFDVTAKDIRGLHANEEMKQRLRAVRKGKLPEDPKERKAVLKDEFKKALEETAKIVGHEASTLKGQYLVPGLEDEYVSSGEIVQKLDKSAAVVTRYLEAAKVVRIDGPWVDKMRKDFLMLMKNIPRAKDYDAAIQLKEGFDRWRRQSAEFFFKRFLDNSLKYDDRIVEKVRKEIERNLRKPAKDFFDEAYLPIERASDYTPASVQFERYLEDVKKWEKKTRRKAQVFWKALKEALSIYEKGWYKGPDAPSTLQAEVPVYEKTVIEGFQIEVRGYEQSDDIDREAMPMIREALKRYRERAAKRIPWVLKNQLPLVLEFEATLDVAGRYNHDGTITIFASAAINSTPDALTKTMAHEMGHHLWRLLSGDAREYWSTAISGDYGKIDVRELLSGWPEGMWAYEYADYLADKDPILSLQLETVWPGYGGRQEMVEKQDFEDRLEEGYTTLSVPKNPISGYASKNPEEAFCEAVGMTVAYGNRAVLPQVRKWLNTVIPGQVKIANIVSRYLSTQEGL